MIKLEWKSGVVKVAVMGQVCGDFGVRLNKGGRSTVTHLPSGFTCGVFDDEVTAKAYVERVVGHPEWKGISVDLDGTAHVPKDLAAFCADQIHRLTAERTVV